MNIGDKEIGDNHPCYIISEIGINHNGDIAVAEDLIRAAADAGADAVKFQKRTPEICTPKAVWDNVRDTPWGPMRYIEYRQLLEFDHADYDRIAHVAFENGMDWFASPWDIPSFEFLLEYAPPVVKVASAMLTNIPLIERIAEMGVPAIISTGGATLENIYQAQRIFGRNYPAAIMHCVAAYPVPDKFLNLRVIGTLRSLFPKYEVGYSGHEIGIATTVAAVALGANLVERHITLDRSMWGTDQSASIEPHGFKRMVRDIRAVEDALGSSAKTFLEIEKPAMEKLRYWE